MSAERDPTIDEQQLDRAYQAGQRQAEMGATIASHERRLNTINGSISRAADNTAELTKKIDAVITELATTRAVAAALSESVKSAAAKQISGRGFFVGIATVLIMLLGVIASVLAVVHP